MIRDVKSSYLIAAATPSIAEAVGTVNSAAFDHSLANSCSFVLNAGLFEAGGTVDSKLQYSDDGIAWTDEDGATGNDTAITQMTATGIAQLNVVNPQGRFSRVANTVGTAAVTFGTISVGGPLRTITPTDL